MKNEKQTRAERQLSDSKAAFRTILPVAAALFMFLLSAGYIAYRMVNNYNYNERWKDYDECGLG